MKEPSTDPNETETENTGEGSSPPAAPDSQEYKVGYGRPPLETRFKPGRSGNAKGRPPKRKNLRTVIEEAFGALVIVRVGEKTRKMTRLEALVWRTVERALKGDDKATVTALKMAQELHPSTTTEAASEELSPADRKLLDQIIGELAKTGAPE